MRRPYTAEGRVTVPAVNGDAPRSHVEMLDAEHAHVHGGSGDVPPRHHCAHSALCLSGGGIRSATFALGVLQALAGLKLLGRFDYLSTVSGGGFTGGWLAAWLHHAGPAARDQVFSQLGGDTASHDAVEPTPIARMRAASRYMSPDMGMFSADAWTLVATIVRNLLLNVAVLLPLLAAALLLPHVYLAVVQGLYRPVDATATLGLDAWLLLLASGLATLVAIGFIVLQLPSYGNRGADERSFIAWSLVPLTLGVIGLSLFWTMEDVPITRGYSALAGATAGAGVWTMLGLLTGTRRWRPRTSVGAAVAGAIATTGLYEMGSALFPGDLTCGRLFAVTAVPLTLGVLLVATFVFIGLASAEIDDADLEWWSRVGSWMLIVGIGWLALSGVVAYGPQTLRALREGLQQIVPGLESDGHATGVIGIVTSALGALAAHMTRGMMTEKRGESSPLKSLVVGLAAPAFVVLLLASVAWMNEVLIEGLYLRIAGFPTDIDACGANYLRETALLGGAFVALGLVMGRVVPVNQFSLHGMYRERLIRAFLGASRPPGARRPSPFTGFDPADDLPMSSLTLVRPLPVINMTLNRATRAGRGGAERRAEAFTATPLFVGAESLGYRPVAEYGSNPRIGRRGLSLGTAMTISGAAASPNMGARSSPALAFLLTFFNARLGAWFGNPGPGGERTWRASDLEHGVAPLLREMLGRTGSSAAYVQLSDGGHYENLGLRQMVERRCRFILVSDAGCDEGYSFEDLATAVRQTRIDLGIPIVFPRGVAISREGQAHGNPHFAVGRIVYGEVDGPAAEDGILIYVKATLSGDEPLDVTNYAAGHPAFPHESTTRQWFGEAQFESYRMLGYHSVMQVAEGYRGSGDVADFFAFVDHQSTVNASPE